MRPRRRTAHAGRDFVRRSGACRPGRVSTARTNHFGQRPFLPAPEPFFASGRQPLAHRSSISPVLFVSPPPQLRPSAHLPAFARICILRARAILRTPLHEGGAENFPDAKEGGRHEISRGGDERNGFCNTEKFDKYR